MVHKFINRIKIHRTIFSVNEVKTRKKYALEMFNLCYAHLELDFNSISGLCYKQTITDTGLNLFSTPYFRWRSNTRSAQIELQTDPRIVFCFKHRRVPTNSKRS